MSSRRLITSSNASNRDTSSASPAALDRRSRGRATSMTWGKAASASPRAPRTPYRRRARSPWETALAGRCRSGRTANPAAWRAASRSSAAPPTAATSSPSAHSAPRCVFTPRVIRSMVTSPTRPIRPSSSRSPTPAAISLRRLGDGPERGAQRLGGGQQERQIHVVVRAASTTVGQAGFGAQIGLLAERPDGHRRRAKSRPASTSRALPAACRRGRSSADHQVRNWAGGSYSPPDQAMRSSMLRAASRERPPCGRRP